MATYAQLLNGTDKEALAAAGQAYNDAKARGDTAGMDAAHQQAEAIRANYGYSGGNNGAQVIPTSQSVAYDYGMTGNDQTQLSSYGSLYNDAMARYNAAVKAGNSQAASTAQADMLSAHASAENLRKQYGYSGGTNGSGSISTNYIDKNGNSKSGTASMDYYNNLLTKLNTMYQNAVGTNNSTYAAQLQEAMANLEKQKQALNLSYDNAAKQLYVDKRMSEKNTPQALAAQGYNGGLTESSLLGIQSGYENNLLTNEQNRNQGLANLEYQKISAQSENAVAAAQAAQEAGENYYTNYASIMAQLAAQQNYDSEQAQTKEENTQETYQNLLSYLYSAGMTPTAAQLSAAYGITAAEAQNLLKAYTGKTAKSSGSSGSSATSTTKKTTASGGSGYALAASSIAQALSSGAYTITQAEQAAYNAYKNGEVSSSEYMTLMNRIRG